MTRFHESDDAYPSIRLNSNFRVIACPLDLQWIVQKRAPNRNYWRSLSFCRTRPGLIRFSHEKAGELEGSALARLKALPPYIGAEAGRLAA